MDIMSDMIKIPYIGKEYHIDFFFGGQGMAQETKNLLAEYPDEIEPVDVLSTANHVFVAEWSKLSGKFGHLYGLWDDCIEPQIREWFGFAQSDRINAERQHIYLDCRHHLLD